MNPYETPATFAPLLAEDNLEERRFGPGLIALLLLFAVLAGLLSLVVPSLRAFTMPRFGWIGLVLCLNPLIFLLPWLRTPTRPALIGSAFMIFSLAVINAVQLLFTGTVSIVTNSFTDRLHSSWLWSVLPLFIAGCYLYWRAARMSPNRLAPSSGDQT